MDQGSNGLTGAGDAISFESATKSFGSFRAVSELTWRVPRGSLCGLLGPNGSGKTTTLRMAVGILRPDTGRAHLFGEDPRSVAPHRIGYLPEERGLYKKMKVLEQLVFMAQIRGVDRKLAKARASEWLERMALADRAEKAVQDLSKGMQQKVQFIGTVLHEPELLLLDEPFSGLDPVNQDVLEEIVRDFHAKGVTIVLSTHMMDQAERLCERVCLISRSKLVLDEEVRELKRRESGGIVAIDFEGPDHWLAGSEVQGVERTASGVRLQLMDRAHPHRVLERAVGSGARITRFQLVEPRLHEIFVRHVGADAAAGSDGLAKSEGRSRKAAAGRGA